MWTNFKNADGGGQLLIVIILCLMIFIFVMSMNLVQTKEFKGYYLNCGNTGYQIMINWENRQDSVAFRSMNVEETLRVYNLLMTENRRGVE